ncbi:MAG: PTS sugar transporter subunit IIA [Rhodothermales bacterium]|nr:PTS sugar transporter subunit IIA [Rhodothermales bacterium]
MATHIPQIHDLLSLETVRVGLPGQTKEDVLAALLDVLMTHPAVVDADAMREAVFAREQVMSTGVGKGLGLPHAKTHAVRQTVAAFAITAEPVPFAAIDDQPVRMLFLLVGPERATSEHIKVLSRISRLLNRDAFRQQLLDAPDAASVLTLLEVAELQYAAG